MSKQNLQAFYREFRADLSLQKQLNGITDSEKYAEKAVELGKQAGFEFAIADVKAALTNPGAFLEESVTDELTELELTVISGGLDVFGGGLNLGSALKQK